MRDRGKGLHRPAGTSVKAIAFQISARRTLTLKRAQKDRHEQAGESAKGSVDAKCARDAPATVTPPVNEEHIKNRNIVYARQQCKVGRRERIALANNLERDGERAGDGETLKDVL